MMYLVVIGVVVVGDDLIGFVVGGLILIKVLCWFGEGIVNGVLIVWVGVVVMEVCWFLLFE